MEYPKQFGKSNTAVYAGLSDRVSEKLYWNYINIVEQDLFWLDYCSILLWRATLDEVLDENTISRRGSHETN